MDESWPVRYRFESASALHRHLAAGPFFIPDPTMPGEPGSRVIVEIGVKGGNEHSVVRGRLSARARDGVWLDLAFAHPTAWWNATAGLPRRARRRLGCDLFAEVRPQSGAPWFCRAVDLSEGGVRLATGPFQSLLPGDRAEVSLISSDSALQPALVNARVAWAWGREAGLSIAESSLGLRALIAAIQWRWDGAREIEHRPGCHCETGHRQP
jgi:hypothetical protein